MNINNHIIIMISIKRSGITRATLNNKKNLIITLNRYYVFQNVCQVTLDSIVSQNALTQHTEKNVGELVTAARTRVMCQWAVEKQTFAQQVYTFN